MTMRLEKVELVGFKSFCDRQEVSFQGGVTGIVGPNGCGKSNICDAISWVLGEQSAKSLRGAAMEDVIFAGSQSRQPVAMAEVNLRVSGLNGNSPDGSPECMVTRRLYRNGESEYLMNGQVCRLRDVHELFMDTGLGSKAYSIIEQGKIGLILSSKPADRRALIEEAAGITKYRVRRKQTQLKLDAAQQNLLRVNDIVNEVEKQLESLKRQASKARRYRVQREEMQGFERVLYGLRFRDCEERIRSLGQRIGDESERERAAAIVIETEEAQLAARRSVLYDEEAQLEQARQQLSEATLAVERHESRSGYCREQIAESGTRAAEARGEAAGLEQRVAPLTEAIATCESDNGRLAEQLTTSEEACRLADAAVADYAARLAATEADLSAARDAQVELMSRIATLQNARESAQGSADRASATLVKLATEREELTRESGRATAAQAAATQRGAECEAVHSEVSRNLAAATTRVENARTSAAALAQSCEALQSERDSLAGRLASLEEMVSTHSAFDEGVRALLAMRERGEEAPEGPIEVLGVVADAVETDDPAYERAMEGFLGDRLQALLVPDAAHALRGVRYLERSGTGRGAFLAVASARTKGGCELLRQIAAEEPKVRGLLGDVYRVSGLHAAQVRAALPEALVVASLEDALEVVARHGPVACVTLAGETLRGGLVEGGRGVKGLLAPRREVREVGTRIAEVEARLAGERERERAEIAAGEAAAGEVRSLADRLHACEMELVAVRHELATANEESGRLERKAIVLDTERCQAEEERQAALARVAEILQALETVQADRERNAERVSVLGAAVAQLRVESDTALARASEARASVAALRERLNAAVAEQRRLVQDHTDLLTRIGTARDRAVDVERRREELAAELAEGERQLAQALVARDRLSGSATLVEDKVRDLRNELEGREQALKERRREHAMLRDAVSELDVTKARVEADLDHLTRECHQALSMTAAEAAVSLSPEDQVADPETLGHQIQEIRERLDRMGPVNVLAVEQLEEHESRYEFLTTQRQDLLDSIAELDASIKKIDRTSRERFQEAFQVVNQHFGEVFRQLFGGGTAGLSLIDEEDVLESGIDVMAQPPGKRLQNVMLLSGGEKALTAISLLFAIFQYKPSPFCILDEVDAPLDDANVNRFVKMLEGLKDQTQFVLITHSRKTMEIADRLYGVTMEEPGVSKLVSVRLA